MKLNIILNRDNNNNIGINGELIYNILEDLKWFKEITIGNIIIMWYNTCKSLNTKPLKGRINIVISNNHYNELINLQNKPDYVYKSFESFISNYSYDNSNIQDNFINKNPELFIIGGSKVYEEAYKYGVDSIYETKCVPSFDIKKYSPDVLLAVKNIPVSIFLKIKLKNKFKLIIREAVNPKYSSITQRSLLSRIFVYNLKRLLYPKADNIIAISEGVKQSLVKNFNLDSSKIQTIYNRWLKKI